VRLLIAAREPLTQVAMATAVGVTQPRASQVIKQLAEHEAVRTTPAGFVGRRARLLDLYLERSRPSVVEPEAYWYGTVELEEQARRVVDVGSAAQARVAVSADVGPDLLIPWRHPTVVIVYADRRLDLSPAGIVQAEGKADASVIVRWTDDLTLLAPASPWPDAVNGVPLVDPVQQWRDLIDLGGDDRREAADRLRRAILDRSIRGADA